MAKKNRPQPQGSDGRIQREDQATYESVYTRISREPLTQKTQGQIDPIYKHIVDNRISAIGHFKDFTNYLLVTTVAAVGWTTSQQAACLETDYRTLCVLSLSASIVFGIFTLALIPLISEKIISVPMSIYEAKVKFYPLWLIPWPKCSAKIKWVCWPQHILFIVGVIMYAYSYYLRMIPAPGTSC